jgi:hypothetical protein
VIAGLSTGWRDERGISLSEVMVATMITALVSAAFYGFFFAFADDIERQEARATTLEGIRPAVSSLVIELRQAVDLDRDTAVVERLDSDWGSLEVVFYSDRLEDAPGPERYRYYLDGCVGNLCELMREMTLADAGTGPNWTYTGAASTTRVLTNVRTDGPEPLFSGVSWRGGTEAATLQCDTATTCVFEILRVRLRVDPEPDKPTLPVIEIQEDVRFRNATT